MQAARDRCAGEFFQKFNARMNRRQNEFRVETFFEKRCGFGPVRKCHDGFPDVDRVVRLHE